MYADTIAAAFPLAARYRDLGAPVVHHVRECAPAGAFPWSERHLRCLWYDSRYRPSNIVTADGQQVTVVDPGRWNLEAGPDFVDATLVVDPGTRHMKGDVELHVRPTDWDQHGHKADPRYRRLAAHVTWLPGALSADTLPPGTLQIALQPVFAASRAFSFDTLDIAAYPYGALDDDPPCRQPWRARTPDQQGAVLDAAGQERLRHKTERMVAAIEARGADQVLYEETMVALGYKHNRQPCRDLAMRLPLALLRDRDDATDVLHAYAILCGVSGLLPARAAPAWDGETRAFVRSLWDLWWRHAAAWAGRTLPRENWTLANGRPANHPLRRLMAAAEWFGGPVLLSERLMRLSNQPPREFLSAVLALIDETGRTTFWATRQGLAGNRLARPLALVGPGRASTMIVNVIIPWLAAQGQTALAMDVLPLLPAEDDNQIIRHTAHALFGHDHNPAFYRSGVRQQGLLQVFHDFCINTRGGCADCRFAKALRD